MRKNTWKNDDVTVVLQNSFLSKVSVEVSGFRHNEQRILYLGWRFSAVTIGAVFVKLCSRGDMLYWRGWHEDIYSKWSHINQCPIHTPETTLQNHADSVYRLNWKGATLTASDVTRN